MARAVRCKCPDPSAVALLARISDKDKQSQASLEAQLHETREKLVEPAGLNVVAEYAVRHRGSDLSADRVYMAMIADARAGKFSRLYLHKFDRLARRSYDRELYWHVLTRECGIEVRAALEPYDLTTRAGKLTKKTSEFIADIYLDNLAEEVLKGMRQKLLSGEWVGRAPFGYVNKREEISHGKMRRWVETDPIHGPTVAVAFGRYETGEHTLETLTAWLNEHGYTWERGLPWDRAKVHRLLRNPFYAGRLVWNGLEAQGKHELLITPQTFERCQAILREHDCYRDRGAKRSYALNRILWFADLGCGSHAEYQEHADAAYYRSKLPGPDGSKIYLRCEGVDDQMPAILAGISVPEATRERVIAVQKAEDAQTPAPALLQAERVERHLDGLEQERRGYIRMAARGQITAEEFDEEAARITAAIEAAGEELQALEKQAEAALSDVELGLAALGHLPSLWRRAETRHRRGLAELLFKRVSIDNAGAVLGYRLTDPARALLV